MDNDRTPPDAAALITAIAATRDRAAFALLFEHYAPRLKAYMMRLGADSEFAEEITQETMLTLWRKAALFDPTRASASTWIYTILRNLRIDALRRMQRVAKELDPTDELVSPESADHLLDASERATRLHMALATLSSEQAEVIRLSFFDDRPHAEIERLLGIPLGTVKSRLRLAMARLRLLMDEDR
jgi:RNA polymerase sigma-70 factor (ECF subfamily)